MTRLLVRALLIVGLTPPLAAQGPLSLGEAFRRADSAAYRNRIADGQARAQGAQATAALQGILPSLRVEGGYVRTDDPLGAFGFTLRQRTVSQASFDPARLNHPAPVNDWGTALIAELPLVNPDAWFGRRAASTAAEAARAGADWTRGTTRLDVVRAYYGAIVAREGVRTLEEALAAGDAHLRQAESMVTNGMATRSDALLAAVQRGQIEARLVQARGDAALAREQLALLLGQPGDTAFTLPDSLPPSSAIRAIAGNPDTADGGLRLDVVAARLGSSAARADVRRANAAMLPRLNAFGRYDWNSADAPFGGDKSYTVGVMASWSPFSGGARLADRQGAAARADAAQAMAEAAEATAALEMRSAQTDRRVAIAQLDLADVAVAQATDAHRIVARKYAGGLATVAELLGAAATETATRMNLVAARYHLIVAEATARHASGGDVAGLTALEN